MMLLVWTASLALLPRPMVLLSMVSVKSRGTTAIPAAANNTCCSIIPTPLLPSNFIYAAEAVFPPLPARSLFLHPAMADAVAEAPVLELESPASAFPDAAQSASPRAQADSPKELSGGAVKAKKGKVQVEKALHSVSVFLCTNSAACDWLSADLGGTMLKCAFRERSRQWLGAAAAHERITNHNTEGCRGPARPRAPPGPPALSVPPLGPCTPNAHPDYPISIQPPSQDPSADFVSVLGSRIEEIERAVAAGHGGPAEREAAKARKKQLREVRRQDGCGLTTWTSNRTPGWLGLPVWHRKRPTASGYYWSGTPSVRAAAARRSWPSTHM